MSKADIRRQRIKEKLDMYYAYKQMRKQLTGKLEKLSKYKSLTDIAKSEGVTRQYISLVKKEIEDEENTKKYNK